MNSLCWWRRPRASRLTPCTHRTHRSPQSCRANRGRWRYAHVMGRTYALFGDSIAAGMGVRGRTFGQIVAAESGAELSDFSAPARPVMESLQELLSSDVQPAIAIIAHGVTEAIPRPSARSLRYIPARWRRMGWTDPRPYFSSRWPRSTVQHVESAIRWRAKTVLLRLDKPMTVVSLPEYVDAMSALVAELRSRGSEVLVVSPPPIDARFFPGAAASEDKYLGAIRHLDARVLDTSSLRRWSDFCADHFHPNDAGHQHIASLIIRALQARQR
jgi:hypothetical protein